MTKTSYTSTGKVDIAIVELPEGAKAWMNESYHTNTLWYSTSESRNPLHFDLPGPGNWSYLGPVKDITEKQARTFLPFEKDEMDGLDYFECFDDPKEPMMVTDYRLALSSLLQSIPIYRDNPHGEEPEMPLSTCFHPWGSPEQDDRLMKKWIEDHRHWAEAEQHVFRNAHLLVKKNEKNT